MSTSTSSAVTITSASPLTTTFTPAASCTNNFYTNTESNWYSIGGPLASQCFPSGWASTSQYFSPGICPDGYTQACSALNGAETRATCCPTEDEERFGKEANADKTNSGYVCYTPTAFNFPGQACASIFTSEITTTVTDGSALTVLLATLHTKTEAVNGYGVSIRYDANDFVSSTSSSSSVSGSSSTSNTSSQTSSPTSSGTSTGTGSSSPSSSASSGLSTGAKAGIGVGVAAVALIALFALGFWILKKRRGRNETDYQVALTGKEGWRANAQPIHEVYTPPSELGGSSSRGPEVIELDGSPRLK
ncbi:uncharacterized protein PAC_14214 [Phialocephala subalpina]|uniref:Uncharacterized protein n=1 Tax=Phialocephala subalpina TaxID=576137 RepID=A0A1L7XH88_9HELO|nr:uncharacterized protein PAC_14214 [Phialocephala subalpina]